MEDGSVTNREELISIYQELVNQEIEKIKVHDFADCASFLTPEEIKQTLKGKFSLEELINTGLIIKFGEGMYRTTHGDLLFRLVRIRNIETKKPIPFEFRIEKREEPVPDFGAHKLVDVISRVIREPTVVECLLHSLQKAGYEGLSSYQLPYVEELLAPTYQNFAIVAPTATGKTLTFFLPVLAKALQRRIAQKEGVSSLLVYPRKALERDQLQKMLKMVDAANEKLVPKGFRPMTIGIDDGDTKREGTIKDGETFRKLKCVDCGDGELVIKGSLVVCSNCYKKYEYVLVSKDRIWENKPTILLTNIWTLYRRMLTAKTLPLFQELDFIVLDEAHVYTHFLGGHVSYILRMLRFIAGQKHGSPIFIFSSATIPNPLEFISSLAGVDQDDLFYKDYEKTLEKCSRDKRIMVYLYLLPNPSYDIETLTEALILAVTLWCYRNDYKGITFIDSISEINTLMDYLKTTILGRRRGAEVLDHVFKTENPHPLNDYSWHTLSPQGFTQDEEKAREFVLGRFKESIAMHHGGLDLEERSKIENSFIRGKTRMLLSTSTLELGIDLSDIAIIIQHKLPLTPEGVVQRVGRSGRNPQCFRIALGIVVLPPLPSSTLYMFDDRLRKTLEQVESLPPLRVGKLNHHIKLQSTISLLLLKRSLDGKPTYISPGKLLSKMQEVVEFVRELRQDLDTLSSFNAIVGLMERDDLESCKEELKKLIDSLLKGLEKPKTMSGDFVEKFSSKLEKNINDILDDIRELDQVLSRLERIGEFRETRDRFCSLRVNLEEIKSKLSELQRLTKLAIEFRNNDIIMPWREKNLDIVKTFLFMLSDRDRIKEVVADTYKKILGSTGSDKFKQIYGVSLDEIVRRLISLKCLTEEELRDFIKDLPLNLEKFVSIDLESLYASKAIKRVNAELELRPSGGIEAFEALNLLLGTHFSLLLAPPMPDLELKLGESLAADE